MTTAERILAEIDATLTDDVSIYDHETAVKKAAFRDCIYHDDAYESGWSEGHRYDFGDQSYITIDGRGVLAGSDQPPDEPESDWLANDLAGDWNRFGQWCEHPQ